MAIAISVLTALTTWWTWGALRPVPVVQDEYAYVLQSQIFARGKWTAPPPPVASSFQQPHVLTTPAVASKYPPGHSMLLALGAFLSAPWLAVVVLSGITGGGLFWLASAGQSVLIGMIAWVVWIGDPINLRFRSGYYSEITSATLWIATWMLLQRWRDRRDWPSIILIALCIGWMAITRPLTALAFAIPIGAVIVRDVFRFGGWRQLAASVATGSCVLLLLPVWNVRTTGEVRSSPLSLYRKQFLPFDKPGFGLDTTLPTVSLSPVNRDVYDEFAREHAGYSILSVPGAGLARLRELWKAEWGGWRVFLLPFAIVGLWFGSTELKIAFACALSLFIAYLSYAHWPGWTLYYFETVAVSALCVANGLALAITRLPARHARILTHAVIPPLALLTIRSASQWRAQHIADASYDTAFKRSVANAPFKGVVVFVRYAANLHPHTTVVANSAHLGRDRAWVVIDDPASNGAVLKAAAGRVPLLFEEAGGTLRYYPEAAQLP